MLHWSNWKKLTGKERSIIIRKWHELILENIDDLALIMTLENGKPIADARGEIIYLLGLQIGLQKKPKELMENYS